MLLRLLLAPAHVIVWAIRLVATLMVIDLLASIEQQHRHNPRWQEH